MAFLKCNIFFQMYNNTSICLLYKGQVVDATEMLKNLPCDPNEPVIINFFTVAELSVSDFAQQNVSCYF